MNASVPDNRSIVHLNVADFAVAVERVLDSRLKGRPVIIAHQSARAAVYDMSEEAFQAGVRKGMPLLRAKRKIKDAEVLPPHPDRYERAMRALFQKALPYSPKVENGADDGHLFTDITGTTRLFGPPVDVAYRLFNDIRRHLGFAPVWSVAPNKLVAKVASRMVKPTGEYVVGAGEEASFLSPLPLCLIPGIDAGDLWRFRDLNITRVREVTRLTVKDLEIPFGSRAAYLADIVRGIDRTGVNLAGQTHPVLSAEHVFAEDTNETEALLAVLYRLSETVGHELRRRRKVAGRLRMRLDYSDGKRFFRQKRPAMPTANDFTLFEAARALLEAVWQRRIRIRRMRLSADGLVFPPCQLPLFENEGQAPQKREALVLAMDRIRERFGRDSLVVGRTLAA